MNDTLDYKISVMQAAKEGKEIEALNRHERGAKWILTSGILWNWADKTYRVKEQKPEVVWISDTTTGLRCVYSEAFIPADTIECKSRKFIELTPEVRKALGL